MSIEWKNLRLFNGSQNSAFEELCCQLAHNEKIPPGSIFIRKAPPDAGIECYLKYPNGDEWGWQAKFFLSSPGPKQWSQLDNSVKKALEKHQEFIMNEVLGVSLSFKVEEGTEWDINGEKTKISLLLPE